MLDWIIDFRYGRPLVFRVLLASIVLLCFVTLPYAVPDVGLTRAMGLVTVREKLSALQKATYWRTRALINPTRPVAVDVIYGFVQDLDEQGRIVARVARQENYVSLAWPLADAHIVRFDATRRELQSRREVFARLEIYAGMVVIWIDGEPLNIHLIEQGLAVPEPNPETNIVDLAFATYYWQKFWPSAAVRSTR